MSLRDSRGGSTNEPTIAPSDGIDVRLRYPGQYADGFGLNYNYSRDYEKGTGRYVESDPIGLKGGVSTYSYVNGNALRWFDQTGLACNSGGCWNTPEELDASATGNWREYYSLACAGHDPYACRAGEVASNGGEGLRGLLSEITNRKLAASIVGNQIPICPGNFRMEDLQNKMELIRQGLMAARVAQLRGASQFDPRQVDRQNIADFHHRVFEENGADANVFGGDLWDLIHGSTFTGYDWCDAPACQP